MKTDAELQAAVMRDLRWDTRLHATDIGVAVKDGVVTLFGNVNSWAERKAAQQAAHRVDGVLDVANELTVILPGAHRRGDGELAAAVRHALQWDVLVPEANITTTVSDGVVTLEGSVDAYSQREDAERAVSNLLGVRSVVNRIAIEAGPDAGEIRRNIEDALDRQAQRDAQHIDIDVRGGDVVLSGVVHSVKEKTAVIGAARGTRGVARVESNLRTLPFST